MQVPELIGVTDSGAGQTSRDRLFHQPEPFPGCMMRTAQLLAFLSLGLAVRSTTHAQEPVDVNKNPILREYRAKLPLLIDRYSTNRKIRVQITSYSWDSPLTQQADKEASSTRQEVITDGQQMKLVTLERTPPRPEEVARFWRPDLRFDISRKGGEFKITEQHIASTRYYYQETMKYSFFAHEPMRAGGNSVGTSLFFDDRGKNHRGKDVLITIDEVNRSSWKGKPCIEVKSRWDNQHGMVEVASTYLDPDHDYITIATESGSLPVSDSKKTYKRVDEIEYAPSAEGFPLPKASHRYLRFDDGSTRKVWDVEFLSYERYVPSPAEFQLEKPYGLTTPAAVPAEANPALAPPPARRRWWPWAAVGAGAVLAAVAVLLFRRGRGRTTPPPSPGAADHQPRSM